MSDDDTEDESFDPPEHLETRRLVLRIPETGDADAMTALANDFDIASMTSRMPHPYRREHALEFIERARAGFLRAPTYAVIVRDGGHFAGHCGFMQRDEEDGHEIGYWLGRPYWGNGYATEAAQMVTDLFFTSSRAWQLFGACRVNNRGSRRVLEKCGFQRSGDGMRSSRALGGNVSVHRYRLERSIWESLKGWRGVHDEAEIRCS